MVVCSRCHKPLTRPESIIRGMGPICFGKTYAIRKMIKQGLTKEEILEKTKEEMDRLAREGLKEYKKKFKVKKRKIRVSRINVKSFKKDKNQKTLDSFLISKEDIKEELSYLYKEREELSRSISTLNHQSSELDRFFEIIEKINKLENKND